MRSASCDATVRPAVPPPRMRTLVVRVHGTLLRRSARARPAIHASRRPNRSAKVTRNPSARCTSGWPSAFSNPSTPGVAGGAAAVSVSARPSSPTTRNVPGARTPDLSSASSSRTLLCVHRRAEPQRRLGAIQNAALDVDAFVIGGPHGFVERVHHDRDECWRLLRERDQWSEPFGDLGDRSRALLDRLQRCRSGLALRRRH